MIVRYEIMNFDFMLIVFIAQYVESEQDYVSDVTWDRWFLH